MFSQSWSQIKLHTSLFYKFIFLRCHKKSKNKNEKVLTMTSIPMKEKVEKKISEPMPVGPIQPEEWPIQDASFSKFIV